MDFGLDERQQAVQDLADQILTGQLTPARRKEVDAGEERVDGALWTELARANLARFPNVVVLTSSFELWDPGTRRFDAVFACNSFHWVDPEVRFAKPAALLNVSQQVGGTLGLSALVTVSATATASQVARFASSGSALSAAARNQALVHGWATGFLLAAAFAALAWLSAVVVLRPRERRVPQASTDEDVEIVEGVEVVPAEEAVLSS